MLEILKLGKFRTRFEKLFGTNKSRTLVQSILGVLASSRTIVEIGQTGKDPLVSQFIGKVGQPMPESCNSSGFFIDLEKSVL